MRRQYASDVIVSDTVLAKGYAYASTDKGSSGGRIFELSSGLALGPGWVINLAVVEYVIGRRKVTPSRPATLMVGS